MRRSLCLMACVLFSVLAARGDTTLVFNEVMYHPRNTDATNEANHEWIEFYNQMAVDVDVSNWRVTGEVEFTFPNGTRIPGRGFILVAKSPATITSETGSTNVIGPFSSTNRLSNSGGPLKLYNNAGRLMDHVDYGTEGDWPVTPDGSGVSLAKRNHDAGSEAAANWTQSAQVGGTPGVENFALPSNVRLIAIDAAWKYEASGTDLGAAWRAANYDDSLWSSRHGLTNRAIPGLFNTGLDANGNAVADGGNDAHYILSYTAQGTVGMAAIVTLNHSAWLANDAVSKWISVVNPGTTTINGGGYGFQTTFSLAGFIPSTAQLNFSAAIDNALTNVFLNGVAKGFAYAGFAGFSSPFTINGDFASGVNTLEFGTDNQGAGPGAFRALVSGTVLAGNTNSPMAAGNPTYYFRKSFTFNDDPQYAFLTINPIVADGAVFYLNGVEVYRRNLPVGAVSYATAANTNANLNYAGPITISASNLLTGNNVLAVEVHQAAGSPDGVVLGTELNYSASPEPIVTLALNEFNGTTNSPFWLEVYNYGTNSISLSNYVIQLNTSSNDVDYVFTGGVTLPAGGFLALTNITPGFMPSSGDRIFLSAGPAGAPVLDGIVAKKGPRARSPDGTGSWLIPNAPTPGAANSFVFDDRIVINEIMYNHKSFPPVTTNIPPKDNPEAWIELYNRGSNTVDLSEWKMSGGVSYKFKAGRTLAAGAYLVIADDLATFQATHPGVDAVGNLGGKLSGRDDTIVLEDEVGNPANQVHYYSGGRWPGYADGGGSSLELRDPLADNSQAEAWAASDESGRSVWQTYTYRVVAAASSPTPQNSAVPLDLQWRDFVMGLLSGGECYVDDISVLQSPGAGQIQLINNGNFENGITGWRVIGNHRLSRVEVDPANPANHALHIIATGPQEHMHNHIEATWANGVTITNGQTYNVTFRAKWIAGNNLLNTRGYFNRIARTTPISYPQLNGTPGARNSRYATNVGPTFAGFQHSPVVPQASQAVSVSVVAQDPKGVGACDVWWSVNGGAWSGTAMSLQNGTYVGTIPGQAAATLVQFYVRGTDSLGASSTFPATGSNSGAFYRVLDGQANLASLHNIRILMSPANVSLLHATTNVMSNENLPATVIYDEHKVFYDMRARLKSSERGRPVSARVGFHLEFPPDDLFRGVHPVMLVDRSNGGSRPANEEALLRHIMLHAGVPAVNFDLIRALTPQVAEYGTAIFAPRFEDEFLEAQYGSAGNGPLYELELIYYPTAADAGGYKIPTTDAIADLDYSNLGGDKEPYRYNFITKNHRDADDYSQFITFAKMFSLTGAQLQLETAQTMDLDEWMSAYGAISLCGVGDMYTFGNNHNFMTYIRSDNQKSVYLPWDMDFSFNNGTGSALVGNRNLANIVNLTPNLRSFYAHILDHIDTTFNTAYMTPWITHYGAMAGQNYSADVSYIQTRGDFAKTTISGAGGNAAFAVNTAVTVTNGTGLVTISGTAPVWVKTITINSNNYPISWTSLSGWSITLPVSAASNNLDVQAYDLRGTLTNSATRLVYYTNAAPDPVGAVVFNEIMFNPYLPDSAYVELFNTSSNASFDLSGWRINGLDFTFPRGSFLTNRQFVIVAASAAAYAGAYGFAAGAPLGEFLRGNLQNGGETLTLIKPGATPAQDIVVDRVRYDSNPPWPGGADGTGSSLQVTDSNQDNSRVGNWIARYSPPVYTPAISTPAQTNDGWRFVSTTISSTYALTNQLLIYPDGPGTLWLDDFSLVSGAIPAVGSNYIRGGDFEDAAILADTNIWALSTNMDLSYPTNDAVRPGGGPHSFRMVARSTGSASVLTKDIIHYISPTPPGTAQPSTLSFWYFATNTTFTNLAIRIRNTTLNFTTNISVIVIPTNYMPPQLIVAATNFATPGTTNTGATNLPAFQPLWINEVQPDNLSGISDNFGEREPWIELYNAGTNAVSLDGLYLSTNYANLTNYALPSGLTLAPREFRVIWCDGQAAQTSGTNVHTSFRLPGTSGSIALSRLYNGQPQVLDYVNYAGIHTDRSFGSFPDGQPFERQNFFYVTAGGTNNGTSGPLNVFINEWMASNVGELADPADNDFEDWFELYNPTDRTVDLAGYYLTDSGTNAAGVVTNKFQFKVTTNMAHLIPPFSHLLVWADGETGQNVIGGTNRTDLHVNFALSKSGDAIGIFAPDGTKIDHVTFGPQLDDVSRGRYPDGGASIINFTDTASPRATNYVNGTPNTPPVLAPIGNRFVYLGNTLTFNASAADTDAPPQVLTFTLDPGAPASAGIGGTGMFIWTPNALGTFPLTVRVTDNGTPPLSATEAITIDVLAAPRFTGVTRNGATLELTWGTRSNQSYRIEYKDDLGATQWLPLQTNIATGTTLSLTNTTLSPDQRFYRITVE